MKNFHRLSVPSFDLKWCPLFQSNNIILVCGGGGSMKSGIKNQIQLIKINDIDKIEVIDNYITDEDDKRRLCCGVGSGHINEIPVVIALLDSDCIILLLESKDSGNFSFVKKADFRVDNANEESAANCCLITKSGKLVTGGQDGICKVYEVQTNSSDTWKVNLVAELKGHNDPIMALTEHPEHNWICSSAKDGTCKIWDIEETSILNKDKLSTSDLLLKDIPCLINIGSNQNSNTKNTTGIVNKMQCRGCRFSICGEYLYSIQSGKRGITHLIKWSLKFSESEDSIIDIIPTVTVVASKTPCTVLKLNNSGKYLAVGGSDGNITIFETMKLKLIGNYICHDLPVTGLDFSSEEFSALLGMKFLLTSCSPDRALTIIKVGGYSIVFKFIIILLLILISLFLYFYSYNLYLVIISGKLFPQHDL